ncbi:hypothetical protein NQD34_001518 [Periophthalmus magnuspinnatus]|nr:hypothetical protein NQD34_001518 [Periophthalmus magnuspinnatus]
MPQLICISSLLLWCYHRYSFKVLFFLFYVSFVFGLVSMHLLGMLQWAVQEEAGLFQVDVLSRARELHKLFIIQLERFPERGKEREERGRDTGGGDGKERKKGERKERKREGGKKQRGRERWKGRQEGETKAKGKRGRKRGQERERGG